VGAPNSDIQRISAALRDQWKLDYIAFGHCTGATTFAALQKTFRDRYIYAWNSREYSLNSYDPGRVVRHSGATPSPTEEFGLSVQ
jgi:hypothetical protein